MGASKRYSSLWRASCFDHKPEACVVGKRCDNEILALHTGILPSDELLMAKAHALSDCTKELAMPIDATVNVESNEKFFQEKASLYENLPNLLRPFEDF